MAKHNVSVCMKALGYICLQLPDKCPLGLCVEGGRGTKAEEPRPACNSIRIGSRGCSRSCGLRRGPPCWQRLPRGGGPTGGRSHITHRWLRTCSAGRPPPAAASLRLPLSLASLPHARGPPCAGSTPSGWQAGRGNVLVYAPAIHFL